ncbi:MAG: hypothetical protein A2086_06320 [Spirochaetes bacterium GWD1_27_9]|nr:MAG: hypothetical protein A2086_06320 [Spirochaetes bacterium GWD1_27_9]
MKYYNAGCKVLMTIAILFFFIGLFIVFFNNTPLFSIINKLIDPIFWTNEIISNGTLRYKSFSWGYIGMLNAIWGLYLYFIVKFALMKREKWAWMCIAVSIIIWFILDTWFSISNDLYFNVIVNILFMVSFIIPLILTRKILNN